MTLPYKHVALIYNPNSTSGQAKELAEQIKAKLTKRAPKLQVELDPTDRAGHGTEKAEDLANKYGEQVLIVSVSGDGGYHDIVNGVMKVPAARRPYCAVYPAGNANDHHNATARRDFMTAASEGHVDAIDMISARWIDSAGNKVKKYSHSYVGLGITPVVAAALNQTQLNALTELKLVAKALLKFRGTRLILNGERHRVMSLLCMNVPRMAKVFTVTPTANLKDDKFELVEIRTGSFWKLIVAAVRGIVMNLPATDIVKKFTFTTTKGTLMQLDGEVVKLPPQTEVVVSSEPQVLKVVR